MRSLTRKVFNKVMEHRPLRSLDLRMRHTYFCAKAAPLTAANYGGIRPGEEWIFR